MPAWGAVLTPQQIETLWDFVMSQEGQPDFRGSPGSCERRRTAFPELALRRRREASDR